MSTAAPEMEDARTRNVASGDPPTPIAPDTADAALAAYAELLGKQIDAASDGDLDLLDGLTERRSEAGGRLAALVDDPASLDPVMVARVRELDQGLRAQLRRMRQDLRERLDQMPRREAGLRRYLEMSGGRRPDRDHGSALAEGGTSSGTASEAPFHRGQGNLDVRG